MQIGDPELLACNSFFFSGVAMVWYRDIKHEWSTSNQFASGFRAQFIALDY